MHCLAAPYVGDLLHLDGADVNGTTWKDTGTGNNANNLQLTGSFSTSSTSGGITFTGGWAYAPTLQGALNSNAFTITIIFRSSAPLSTEQVLVQWGGPPAGSGRSQAMAQYSTSGFTDLDASNRASFNRSSSYSTHMFGPVMDGSSWNMLTMSKNGNKVTYYINGLLANPNNFTQTGTAFSYGWYDFAVGVDPRTNNTADRFSGAIGLVMVHSYAHSATQVSQVHGTYQARFGLPDISPTTSGLFMHVGAAAVVLFLFCRRSSLFLHV